MMKRQIQWAKKYHFCIISSDEDNLLCVHPDEQYVVSLHRTRSPYVHYRGEIIGLRSNYTFSFRTQGCFRGLLESIHEGRLGSWYFNNKALITQHKDWRN